MFRDHHQVANTRDDVATTAGARVHLACLIGLDRLDDKRSEWRILHTHHPSSAQATTSRVMARNTATAVRVLSCWRNGLEPTARQRSCSVVASR